MTQAVMTRMANRRRCPSRAEIAVMARSPRVALSIWHSTLDSPVRMPAMHYSGHSDEDGAIFDAQAVARHMERFFASRKPWRPIAMRLVEIGYRGERLPEWLLTMRYLLSLGQGELILSAPSVRGMMIAERLMGELSAWLEKHPLPGDKGFFMA